MAIVNQPGMFSGGAVVFNSNPSTQFAINMMARQAAKRDALDQYYRELDNKVNQAGMRTNEIPVLMQNENARHQFYLQNRDKILNPKLDNGQAQTKFNQMFQNSLGIVGGSKIAAQDYKPIQNVLADPNKRSRLTDGAMQMIHANDEPMYSIDQNGSLTPNPNYKKIDYTSLAFDNPFDQQKFLKNFSDIKRVQVGLPKIDIDPNTYRGTITTTQGFDDNAKRAIAGRAMVAYRNDNGFQDEIDKLSTEISKDPSKYDEYNNVFKQSFGKDLDIHHPEDLAAAYTMRMLQPTTTETKPTEDIYGRQKALEAIRYGHEKGLVDYRKAAGAYNYGNGVGQNGSGNALDAMPDVVKENYFIQGGTWYNKNGSPVDTGGGQTFISKQEIPATWLSTLKSGGLPIDKIRDGVYATIKDGKIQSIYNKQIGTVTRQQMEGVYQPKMDTEPLKGQHLQFAQNGNPESVPPKTWKHNYINPKTKQKAHSDDGINWFDDNGKPIK